MKKLNKPILATALCALLCLAALAPAQAAPADNCILLILDCSGSMWGRVEGKAKISLAKEVTRELIKDIPANVQLGLMVYGHRRKGDCKDIETIGKPGADRKQLDGAVQKLSARGKTPIADSLLKAGELLGSREGDTTLVLVSDGLETCGGDPCKVSGELRKKGLKLVIHVVGFDVSSKEAAQLKCIAKAGGGQYFQADNLAQLKAALAKIKSSVVEKKPLPPAPKPAEAKASASKSKRIRIAGPGTVTLKPASWVKMPREWALLDAESGQEKARGAQKSLKVKAGEYQILWQQSEHYHRPVHLTEVVKVKSGKTVEAVIDTGLRITAPKGIKKPHSWSLLDHTTKNVVYEAGGTFGPEVTPAGAFILRWHQRDHESAPVDLAEINIEAGKLNDYLADHGLNLKPAGWVIKRPYYYALLDDKGRRLGKWNFYAPQLVQPGKYKLVFRPTEHNNNELLWGEVTIPEHGFAEVAINSGAKFIHAKGAKPPYRIIFVNLDNKKEYVANETWEPLPLPPGRYRLDWWENQHGTKRTTLADEVAVEPGVLLEVEL